MSHPGSRISKFARDENDHGNNRTNDQGLQTIPVTSSYTLAGPATASRVAQPVDDTVPIPTSTATASTYVLPLSTNVPILNFPPSAPASSYTPSYIALPDGSLLTPLYTQDLAISNGRLFGCSALLTLFIINVWIATTFLRRAQLSSIKDKTLFYLLLASQLMGPIAFASLLAPFFSKAVNCTVVNTIAFIATEFSYALLITAILGLKAYKCLNCSRVVIAVLTSLQLIIFVLFSLDLPNIRSYRLLSGACNAAGEVKYTPAAIILMIFEAFLIGLCFTYAVWKSSLYPVAQGRLSIALSVAPNLEHGLSPTRGTAEDENIRRGWWDYVPQAPAPLTQPPTPAQSICRFRESLRKPFSPVASAVQREFGEKSPRRSAMRKLEGDVPPYPGVRSNVGPLEGSPLPISTNNGRPTKQKERQPYEGTSKDLGMVQMRAVIMSELISAGCVATTNIATAVLTAMGAQNGQIEFGTSMRLGAIWAFNSLIIMRSFSSVVRRHEKDAIVQQYHPPATMVPWARRRRDAVATFQPYGGVHTSSRTLAPGNGQPIRRSNTGATIRSQYSYTWEIGSTSGYSSVGHQRDRGTGIGIESETDTASILRGEGLREWALEREARRASASAAAGSSSLVPPGAVNGNPFADAEAVPSNGKHEEGDPGQTGGLESPSKSGVERAIIVREPTARGRRRGAVTDLAGPRRKSGGPPLPPPRHSSSPSVAAPSLPHLPPGALERRPSVASSQASVEHSADEPLLSPRTSARD